MVFFAWNAQWWYWLMTPPPPLPLLSHLTLLISVLSVCFTDPPFNVVWLWHKLSLYELSAAECWTVCMLVASEAFYAGRFPFFLVTVHDDSYLTFLITSLPIYSTFHLPPLCLSYTRQQDEQRPSQHSQAPFSNTVLNVFCQVHSMKPLKTYCS